MAEVGLNLQLVAGGLGDRVAAQLIPEIAALLMPGNHTGPLESGDSYGLDQFGLSPAPRRDRGGFAGLGIGVDKLYALTRDGFASEGGGQLPSTLQPLTYGAAALPTDSGISYATPQSAISSTYTRTPMMRGKRSLSAARSAIPAI